MENIKMLESADIDIKINELKHKFMKIHSSRQDIRLIFENLDTKMKKLSEFYSELIKKNSSEKMFIFGLDSFHFQNKIINKEYSDMNNFYSLITNRIYSDYYKLLKMINQYVNNNINNINAKNINLVSKHPKYDDINNLKHYDLETTQGVFLDIINALHIINENFKTQELDLVNYEERINLGFNINNFIHSFSFKNNMLKEQLFLYINYSSFFIQLHTKYLSRFTMKLKIMHGQVNNDIRFDENALMSKNKQKDNFMNELNNTIDPKIMKDVQKSLETSSLVTRPSTASSESTITNEDINIQKNEVEEINRFLNTPSSKVKRNSIINQSYNEIIPKEILENSTPKTNISISPKHNYKDENNIIVEEVNKLLDNIENNFSNTEPEVKNLIIDINEIKDDNEFDTNDEFDPNTKSLIIEM
jgi:hypothetical protein